ncbi:MAG: HEAT repeat domain-containing protein [Gemmataceae bacterium]|nr:HEAT repeat domain-containing protein [Gemmataceae bacterium]
MHGWIVASVLCAPVPVPPVALMKEADEAALRAAGLKLETETLLRLVERIGGKPLPAARVKELVAQMGDDSFDKREAAMKALAEAGPPMLPALRAVGGDAEVAARLKRLIATFETEEKLFEPAVRVLLLGAERGTVKRLLALPDAGFRFRWLLEAAAMAERGEAKALGNPGPRRELMAGLGHADEDTRKMSRELLVHVLGPDSFGDLVRLTKSENKWVRANAAMLFVRHQDKPEAAFKAIRPLLKDKEPNVRCWAMMQMCLFCSAKGAVETLIGLLEDSSKCSESDSRTVGSLAASSLNGVKEEDGKRAIAALAGKLGSADRELVRMSLRTLGEIGSRSDRLASSALPHLKKALKSADSDIKQHAAWGLALMRSRGRSAEPALLRALAKEKLGAKPVGPSVIGNILWALREMGATADAAPALINILKSGEADRDEKESAIHALASMKVLPPTAVAALQKAFQDDPVLRVRGEAILKRTGHELANPHRP